MKLWMRDKEEEQEHCFSKYSRSEGIRTAIVYAFIRAETVFDNSPVFLAILMGGWGSLCGGPLISDFESF